ncbi:hypothetical protein [Shivajiella indica]|uniref:Uncharacterized protein n=1 Tax=Shivajiella indica TaxID=872115 RepID=A0ABW5B3G1_9BACT
MTLTRRTRFLILILFFITGVTKAGEYYFFRTDPFNYYRINGFSFLPEGLNLEFLDSLNKVYNNIGRTYLIFNSQKGYKLHVRCTFDLFQLSEDGIENLYKFDNSGYLCRPKMFERDGKIYNLGGYGMWNHNSDLLVFDESTGSWEFVATLNQPLHYTGQSFNSDTGIFVLFGNHVNPRIPLNEMEDHGFFLNWNNKEWHKIKVHIERKSRLEFRNSMYYDGHIELKDFFIFKNIDPDVSKEGLFLVDKNSLEIFFKRVSFESLYGSPYLQIIDNTLFYQNTLGAHHSMDIESMFNNSTKVGYIEILDNSGNIFEQYRYPLLIFLGFSVILLSTFFYVKFKKKEPIKETSRDETEIDVVTSIIKKLGPVSGQTLDIDALDNILGINNIPNLDNRRVRRSRMIMDINTNYRFSNGKDLIKRVKKSDDKRYTYYSIEP